MPTGVLLNTTYPLTTLTLLPPPQLTPLPPCSPLYPLKPAEFRTPSRFSSMRWLQASAFRLVAPCRTQLMTGQLPPHQVRCPWLPQEDTKTQQRHHPIRPTGERLVAAGTGGTIIGNGGIVSSRLDSVHVRCQVKCAIILEKHAFWQAEAARSSPPSCPIAWLIVGQALQAQAQGSWASCAVVVLAVVGEAVVYSSTAWSPQFLPFLALARTSLWLRNQCGHFVSVVGAIKRAK